MPLLGFDEVIRRDLDNIQADTQVSATFYLYIDTNVLSAYGLPAKTTVEIETTVIMSPVRHDEQFIGEGVHQVGDYMLIVHRLEKDGIDYIQNEWFNETSVRNVRITVGEHRYRVLEKQGHINLRDKSPYHVLSIAEVHDR